MSVISTTDLHRFRSSVRSRRLDTSTCSSPMRIGRSGSRELSTIAEFSALMKPDDKK
jgi:hypothetical protein